MLLSVLNRIVISYSRNNNRRGSWNCSCPATALCSHRTWHRLQITWFFVSVRETVIRHSAILSDLHQSLFFSTVAIIQGHQSQVQWEMYALNSSYEYTFQYFIASVKTNSSLKFIECFPVVFILFSETRLIHNAFWNVKSVFMYTWDSITTTNMCKAIVMSAHTYVNS